MQRRALIVGNWKMNGLVKFAQDLVGAIRAGLPGHGEDSTSPCEVVLCPPFTGLSAVQHSLQKSAIRLGAQNMSDQTEGSLTGEVCGTMLRDVGCQYVILGHSERRTLFGEDNEQVAQKMAAAFRDGLVPIVCLGESSGERKAGQTLKVIAAQLAALVPHFPRKEDKQQQLVLAYEPVWAIGTGRSATPDQIQEVHAFIRQQIGDYVSAVVASKIRILYGGSVKPGNAKEIFSRKDVDGGLIGGASLKPSDFLEVVHACA